MTNLQEKAENQELPPKGLYCHIPFCATSCDFCNFYQKAPQRSELDKFLTGMELEFSQRKQDLFDAQTVFWGGGTPGLLMARDLERLGSSMLQYLKHPPSEWTVELAPSTVKADKLQSLLRMGVNRLSMGVQSFSPTTLERLGRQHSSQQVYKAYDLMRQQAGFAVNFDLIFAIPGQTLMEWEQDLLAAIKLRPEHISTYCLTFEEDTALWVKLQKGLVKRRSEDEEAKFYTLTWDILDAHGYGQYEVSNFALPGHACRHNLHTWEIGEWVGCGPSASSQIHGWRRTHPHSMQEWLQGLATGVMPWFDEVRLTDSILATDALVFGLRCNAGIHLTRLQQRFTSIDFSLFEPVLNDLVAEGLLSRNHSLYQLTPAGRLLADAIGSELIGVI
ncbi:MAG: radical SAM family heme chaperone HemW [Verrucomicrobia bacterium]|nr:radical SAM family heme chaperone HemW [Verrucomicrobiota bacterium]